FSLLPRYRLRVRTLPSPGKNPGSNPGIATNRLVGFAVQTLRYSPMSTPELHPTSPARPNSLENSVSATTAITRNPALPLSNNDHLLRWVEKMAELTRPARIHWVDGSEEEYEQLCAEMVASGTLVRLNQKLWPGCFLARSHKSDVARVEDRTFICSLSKDSVAPTI